MSAGRADPVDILYAAAGFCLSTRGEWGGICPDCGERLPEKRPIRSWMASKELKPGVRWDGAPLTPRNGAISEAQRNRWFRPSTGRGRAPRLLMPDVAAAIREHAGNVNAASAQLGAARQSIIAFLGRNRADIPVDVRDLIDSRRRPRRAGLAPRLGVA